MFQIQNIAELTCMELISCQSFIQRVLQVLKGSPANSGFHMDIMVNSHISNTHRKNCSVCCKDKNHPSYKHKLLCLLMIFSTTVGGVMSPCKGTGVILSSAKVSLPNNAPLLSLFSGIRIQHC